MQIIQISDLNDQLIETSLDGTTFFIRLTWNETAKQFFLGLQNADSVDIINGIGVVTNYPLFWRFRRQTMPLGDFYVEKPLGGAIERNSFIEGKASLVYFSESDLEAMGLLDAYGRI